MDMLDIFKETLQNGMEITKFKESGNKYKITLSYKDMSGTCELNKLCTPGNEKSLCMQAIDTAMSSMYIDKGDLKEAQAWLHGERWNLRKSYNEDVMKALRQHRGLEPDDTTEDADIMNMSKQDVFNNYCQWNGLLGGYGYALLNVVEDIYDINLQQ